MTGRWRLALLAIGLALLAPGAWTVVCALPAFGAPVSAYGSTVNALLPHLRGIPNMVAAVNFDVRGLDTLGEESMLLAAVIGTVVLLRGRRGEDRSDRAGTLPGRGPVEHDDATRLVCRIAGGLTLVYGAYVTLHGTVTPGGGFQGGAVLAAGLLLAYLGEGYRGWRALVRSETAALLEGLGALCFVLAAGLPLLWHGAALQNLLPPGKWKDLYSGGLMVVVNAGVALAVVGGFADMALEFLEETRSPRDETLPDEENR